MLRYLLSLLVVSSLVASASATYVPSEFKSDYDLGYDTGYEVGYASGYGRGEEKGITVGTKEGKETGFDDGWRVAYQPAYDASYEESYQVAFGRGYDTAFAVSYQDGAVAGIDYVDDLLRRAQRYFTTIYPSPSSGVIMHGIDVSGFNIDYCCAGTPGSPGSGVNLWGSSSAGFFMVDSRLRPRPVLGADHYYGVGFSDGKVTGRDVGYDDGYDAGYLPAYEAAYDVAFDDGSLKGTKLGLLEGGWDGTNEGWVAGVADGDVDGYDYGFDDGLTLGLASLNQTQLDAVNALPVSFFSVRSRPYPLDPWSLGVVPVPEPATASLVLCVIALAMRRSGINA